MIGGTGHEGRGLGLRLALAGERVVVGSRERGRAALAAASLNEVLAGGGAAIGGASNAEAASQADLACICLPAAALAGVLPGLAPALRGKVVIEVVNPVERGKDGFRLRALPAPSAAEHIAGLLPGARVVSAFKTLAASSLETISMPLAGDCLVCGDDAGAKEIVAEIAGRMPALRAVDAGPLRNARYVEAAMILLLEINRLHRATTSLQVVGLGPPH